MIRSGAAVRAVILAATIPFASAASPSPASHATPVLDQIAARMAHAHDYAVTIDAHEVDGSRVDDRVMRFWYLAPNHAKLEVENGKGAGTRLIWSGGDRVQVRGGIFSVLPITLDLHDSRITSPRGNTMLRAEFGPTVDCFVAHRSAVTETPGSEVGGKATVLITLAVPSGIDCPADSAKDRAVTKDMLTVERDSAIVIERQRFVGDTLVERWKLSDVKFDAGLTEADFH
jgi:hypothetical protein